MAVYMYFSVLFATNHALKNYTISVLVLNANLLILKTQIAFVSHRGPSNGHSSSGSFLTHMVKRLLNQYKLLHQNSLVTDKIKDRCILRI